MAFQFQQQNLPSAMGKERITNLDGILPEESIITPLANAAKQVADSALQSKFNEEVQKKQMEAEQRFKSGETVEEFREKESWVNTIFGKSASLETAIGLQAEASYYNGYSDIMSKMEEYSKVSPEEFSGLITDTYSSYLTGDPDVDSLIRQRTKASRDSLMKAHARGHQKFVQQQQRKSTLDLVRAKQSAYELALKDEMLFGDAESFTNLRKQQVADLSEFYYTVATQGENEASVVANQVLLSLQQGDATAYEAIKDNMALFSQQDESRITSAYNSLVAKQTTAQEVQEVQRSSQEKAQVRSALDQGLKNPLATPTQLYSQIDESQKAGFLTPSVAETYYRKATELHLKQSDWTNGLKEIANREAVSIPSEELEDAMAYTFNLLDSAIADPDALASAKATVRNKYPESSSYVAKNGRALENLVIDEQPNPQAVSVVEELMRLNEVGGSKIYALRQLGNETVKAKFSRVLAEVEDRMVNSTGGQVNLTGAIRDALMEVDRMDKLSEISTTPPKSLSQIYKEDNKQYKKDLDVISDFSDAEEDSLAYSAQVVRLREEMDKTAKRNPNLPIETIRDIAVSNLSKKSYDKISGLDQETINNDPVLAVRGMFEDTHDQVQHYIDFRKSTDTTGALDGYNNYDVIYSPNGNFVLFEREEGDEGIRTGRFFAVPKEDIAAAWQTSETYMKKLKEDEANIREQAIAQGLEVPPVDVEDTLPVFQPFIEMDNKKGYVSGTEEGLFGTDVSAMDIRNEIVNFFQDNNYGTLVIEPLLEQLGIEPKEGDKQ